MRDLPNTHIQNSEKLIRVHGEAVIKVMCPLDNGTASYVVLTHHLSVARIPLFSPPQTMHGEQRYP